MVKSKNLNWSVAYGEAVCYIDTKPQTKKCLYIQVRFIKTSFNNCLAVSESFCVKNGTWDFKSIKQSFGSGGVTSLYVFSIGIFLLNLSLFMATMYKFYKCQQLTHKQVRKGPICLVLHLLILQKINQSFLVSTPLMLASYQMLSISNNAMLHMSSL